MRFRSLILAAGLCLTSCAEETFTLSFRPTEGEPTRYEYGYRQQIVQRSDDVSTTVDQTLTFVWSEESSAGEGGGSDFELTFEAAKFQSKVQQSGGRTITESFDSNDPDSKPSITVRGYQGLVGRSVSFTQDGSGALVEVRGCEELAESILRDFYDFKKPGEAAAGEAFARQISTDAITDTLRPVKFGYPTEPVAVGDTWNRRIEITAGFPHVQDSIYEVLRKTADELRALLSAAEGESAKVRTELAEAGKERDGRGREYKR